MRTLVVLLLLIACSKADDKPDPEPSTPNVQELYDMASQRLTDGFVDRGWVVTRKPDGSPEHVGEGLIWSGVAMAAMTCEKGSDLELRVQEVITRWGGGLVRYEPLGEYAGGGEVTLDGALGLYYGIASRIARCPGSADSWRPVIEMHLDYLSRTGGRFNQNSSSTLAGDFDYVLSSIADRLSIDWTGRLSHSGLQTLMVELSGWAAVVNATHKAAFRINLAFITIQTIEVLGIAIPEEGRNRFCAATRGVDIPTVDHWCGRKDIRDWINHFTFNLWEYRHQRSGSWEGEPDADGDQTPGLDLLVAIKLAYNL